MRLLRHTLGTVWVERNTRWMRLKKLWAEFASWYLKGWKQVCNEWRVLLNLVASLGLHATLAAGKQSKSKGQTPEAAYKPSRRNGDETWRSFST
eukprot:1137556-Pelagomonas_calceolata.AAC.1